MEYVLYGTYPLVMDTFQELTMGFTEIHATGITVQYKWQSSLAVEIEMLSTSDKSSHSDHSAYTKHKYFRFL